MVRGQWCWEQPGLGCMGWGGVCLLVSGETCYWQQMFHGPAAQARGVVQGSNMHVSATSAGYTQQQQQQQQAQPPASPARHLQEVLVLVTAHVAALSGGH